MKGYLIVRKGVGFVLGLVLAYLDWHGYYSDDKELGQEGAASDGSSHATPVCDSCENTTSLTLFVPLLSSTFRDFVVFHDPYSYNDAPAFPK